jgi:hypothetical protein
VSVCRPFRRPFAICIVVVSSSVLAARFAVLLASVLPSISSSVCRLYRRCFVVRFVVFLPPASPSFWRPFCRPFRRPFAVCIVVVSSSGLSSFAVRFVVYFLVFVPSDLSSVSLSFAVNFVILLIGSSERLTNAGCAVVSSIILSRGNHTRLFFAQHLQGRMAIGHG